MTRPPVFVGPLDRVLFLRTLAGFEWLPPAALAALARHLSERFVGRGDVLDRAGGPVEAAYLVVDGELRLTPPDGPPRTITASESCGLLELLARAPADGTVTATADTVLLELDLDGAFDAAEEHFDVLRQYLRFLGRRFLYELRRLPDGTRLALPDAAVAASGGKLDLVQRLQMFTRARVFSDCNLDALLELARNAEEQVLPEHAPAWQAGDQAGHFFLVTSGSLRARMGSSGRELLFGPGFTVGMPEAVGGFRRPYDLVPERETVVLRLAADLLLDLLEDYPEMGVDVTAALSRRVLDLETERRRR